MILVIIALKNMSVLLTGGIMDNVITQELLDRSYSYESYKMLISNLLSENKTTGKDYGDFSITFHFNKIIFLLSLYNWTSSEAADA